MKNTVRLICAFLLLIIAVSVLAGCGGDNATGDISLSTDKNDNQDTPNTDKNEAFRLPAENFDNTIISVLSYKQEGSFEYQTFEIAPTAINTDPVNDIAYDRAELIKQNYGIVLEQYLVDTKNDVVDTVREMVETGLDSHQIVVAPLHYLAKLVGDGAYYDLGNTGNDYIDLSRPYWDQKINQQLSVFGKHFFVNGDAIVSDDEATWAVFFNKTIASDFKVAEEFGVNSIYELVDSGDWTIDTMYEMAKMVVTDDQGDGMIWSATSKDIWGINAQAYDGYTFTVAAGYTMTELDNEGKPMVTLDQEAAVNAYGKIHEILNDKTVVALAEVNGKNSTNRYAEIVEIFANGGALFMPEKIGTVSNSVMRSANIKYGLLPMPKIDKEQEKYTSTITVWWCSAMAIPVSNVDKLSATCYAMEALAYYGQEMVTPEYYSRTLKNKRFEDDESEEMLDLIFRNRTYDIGIVLNLGNDMLGFYDSILISGNNTLISSYEAKRDAYQDAIDDFADMFLDN